MIKFILIILFFISFNLQASSFYLDDKKLNNISETLDKMQKGESVEAKSKKIKIPENFIEKNWNEELLLQLIGVIKNNNDYFVDTSKYSLINPILLLEGTSEVREVFSSVSICSESLFLAKTKINNLTIYFSYDCLNSCNVYGIEKINDKQYFYSLLPLNFNICRAIFYPKQDLLKMEQGF